MDKVAQSYSIREERIAAQTKFGDYIVARQRTENLHKPLQCYKDDYVKSCITQSNLRDAVYIIDTFASDLKLFDIKGGII